MELLEGKWKTYSLIIFIFSAINAILSFIPYAGYPIQLLISGSIQLTYCLIGLKVLKGDNIEISNALDGFLLFFKATALYLYEMLLVILWSLLLIVPGIIKSFSYSMAFYILAENPDISVSDALKESENLMEGHRMELFKLHLSFIGWIILSVFTLGFLFIWVAPYIDTSIVVFYNDLKFEKYGTYTPYTEFPETADYITPTYTYIESSKEQENINETSEF